jgi:hypothetical protein
MAWTIHHWSAERGVGTIKSPHFGPVPFDAGANVDKVDDYREGEPVLVELEGEAPNFRVRKIRPMCQRQPDDSHFPGFDAVNGRFGDASIEKNVTGTVQFWVGDCCGWCTPNAIRVRFDEVASVTGIDDDFEFADPLFRLASPAEVRANQLVVPSGYTAFCVVTSHGQGPDGPPIFIVARAVQVVQPERTS